MDVLLRLFAFTVYAAEVIISPLPDIVPVYSARPSVSFGQLIVAMPTPQILAETIEAQTTTMPDPTPTRETHQTKSKTITIALLGDSMIDTLGPGVPHLQSVLSKYYPGVTFNVLNYGIGATNIDDGLPRLTRDYTYEGKHMNALVSQQPDIVVVESFGYNPYPTDNDYLNRHWMALAHIVDGIRANLPNAKIVIAATIAPNWDTFGDGAAGLAFDLQDKKNRVVRIKEYLENTIKFAKSQQLPLANSYHTSLDSSGNGKLAYINGGDHIHYSDAGRALFASKVFEAIRTNKLLE